MTKKEFLRHIWCTGVVLLKPGQKKLLSGALFYSYIVCDVTLKKNQYSTDRNLGCFKSYTITK